MPFGLPTVPPELKQVSPFLQRAEELRASEPIVAYWCTYQAAQVGISLGAKGPDSRKFLGDLLGVLESLKANIAATDAAAKDIIDSEVESAAYVETFALKVFGVADSEDRSGKATRTTAKRFLAAANFLEVLHVFDAALVGDQNEKIRYAKWKAADIARAFREGRQPVPGPAGGLEEEIALPSLAEHSVPPTLPIEIQAIASDAMDVDAPRGFESATINMGTWSTVATPGIAPANDTTSPSSSVTYMNATVSGQVLGDVVEVNQIRPSEAHAPIGRSESTASIVDGDTSATALIHANANAQALHLPGAPQLYGGDSALSRSDAELAVEDLGVPVSEAGSTPRADGDIRPTSPPSVPAAPVPSRPMPVSSIPPTPSPAPMPEDDIAAAIPMQPTLPLPPGFVPTPGQTVAPLSPAAAVPPPPVLHHQAPGSPIYPHGQPPTPVATAPPPPPELTPQVISRIQKHCRFAISALDYEDDEQARKELRAALDMLGG